MMMMKMMMMMNIRERDEIVDSLLLGGYFYSGIY
jgi:hypothetical protein